MASIDPIQQLRVCNALFAQTGISSPECAEHVCKAIDFFAKEQLEGKGNKPFSFGQSIGKLVRLYLGEQGLHELAFVHLHAPQLEDFSPLWVHRAVVQHMKKLVRRRAGLILITGLREAVCPPGRYWTEARKAEFNCLQAWVNALICAWADKNTRLQIIIL